MTTLVKIGEVAEALQNGKFAQRVGWNGKNMFLFLTERSKLYRQEECYDSDRTVWIKNARGTATAWVCNQEDFLATDWVILDPKS